ncbi:MAG: phosphatidylserine decarboxylase [Treponema sp.]|nr:phosphatidylserine decarboxylase [Treponema sp.]
MTDIVVWLSQYVDFFPLAAFMGLMLAGINFPISEDIVIITGALICKSEPHLLIPTFIGIYLGVTLSDFVSYWIGTCIRKGALKFRFLTGLLSEKRLNKMAHYLNKYGIITFIICRFIPFGVRNTLFMTSGFSKLRFRRFMLYDLIAATISVSTLFFIVYFINIEDAGVADFHKPLQIIQLALFIFLLSVIAIILFRIILLIINKRKKAGKKFHFPITRYGLPQALVYPLITLAIMAGLFIFLPKNLWLMAIEIVLFLIFIWSMMFFRNPNRKIPLDENTLLAPADGTVTDITETEHPEIGRALRIGIFLSIFNVHINRMPCSVKVESILYRKGKFKNAMSSESSRVNESNELLLTRLAEPTFKISVKQISGAIARRIVCKAKPEQELPQGMAFGMIKFGSRTELYLPLEKESYNVVTTIGEKVNAGKSPLVVLKT